MFGRTEIVVQLHLHGGPNDGVVEEGTFVNLEEAPPLYASQVTTPEGDIIYAYHITRIVQVTGQAPQVHYRYID